MTPPQACPDESILREFLRDQLAGADAERIDDHIGGCPACQRALDRLVGSLPGRWLPDPDGTEGDTLVAHSATASLGVVPRVLIGAIEPGGPAGPVTPPGSPEGPTATDGPARLHLFGEIARGGMGAILRARDVALGRDLAVKVLLDRHRHKPGLIRRFVMEARIAGQLQHPGTVPVHELGALADGRPYFAMKLVKGRTLEAILKERTDPSENLPRFLGIFEQVCQTVAYAHARGIIHRDLKPANVMVGRFGEVQVMDWGLAKVLTDTDITQHDEETGDGALDDARDESGEVTDPGSVLGTLSYMPPEQARGLIAEVDRRSDVFGLGAILAEILTGRPPYIGPDSISVRHQAIAGRLDEVSARLAGCGADSELIQLVRRCLAPDRADRPADGGEIASAVAAYLSGVQERLQQERLARERQEVRAAEGRRRQRVLAAAISIILLTLTLGVVASTIFALRERAARRKAGEEALRATWSEQAAQRANTHTIAALNDMRQAQAETKEALAQSEQARQRAEAVLAFLKNDVLAAARPAGQEGGLGVDVTVRKAVDASEPKIAMAFQDQPIVEADVRYTLGLTYLYLGEALLAIQQIERALELRRTKLGPDHTLTLECCNLLAAAYNVGGRTAEAIALHEATLKLCESKLGPDHPDTLACRNNLASAYEDAGHAAEAIALHQGTLKLSESKLGPDHPHTLISRNNLASAYRAAGRTAEAIALNEETLRLREAKLGLDHPNTLASRNNLAVAYLDAGRAAEAIALHEGTLKLRESKLGPDHPSTLLSRNNLALAYEARGRWADAESLRRDALARRRKAEQPDSPLLAGDLANLGSNLLKQVRWSEAEPLLRECLAIREKAILDDWRRYNTMSQLGDALLGQGRYAEAEPLIVQGYEGMKAHEARVPAGSKSRLSEAAERVVRLYEALGKREEATAWKAKLGLTDLPADVFARP